MKTKLLLVDDEEGIRKVLGIALSEIGYMVFTAENGEEALKIFRKETPPIVLTDIKMPGMDGIELLRTIKRENPDTEVIMITGHGDMDLAIESLKYQAVDFVTKPINDDVLEIALNRAHDKIITRQKLRDYTENLEALVQEKSAKLIELERQAAVGQAVEGLSSAIRNIAGDLQDGITYFNEMPCFVSIHNPDLKIVAINQLFKDRLGDMVGRDSRKIFKPKKKIRPECPAEVTFKTGKGQRSKATVEDLSGREVPVMVHTAPIRNRDGAVELVVEISVDIREVNRLREELRSTQQRYQQLFDEVPCYISVQDKKFRLTATNKRFKEDFDDKTGAPCYEVYRHRNEPCQDCPVAKTFEDGQSHQAEKVVTSKAGEQYNVLIGTAPIRNASGKITQVMELSTNITQIRQLQDHLSSLGLKISSISHGIKSLLAGLDAGMYLVDTGFTKEDQVRVKEGWEIVRIIADRIRKLVLDILYFAKERDLNWEQVDISGFVREVVSTFEPKVLTKDVEFVYDFDASISKIEADSGAVRSALINILENALDACLEDKSKKKPKISLRVQQDNDYLVFEVRDNGVGMDRETKENLFTLFFSSKGAKGTGLGLFIANQIIQQHGGSITVDSTPGKGSHFSIRMPKTSPKSVKRQNSPD
ncbi:MAG: response regulator [Deltaproteobacteria bacterium]|nr:MAG: response regulator [Deltaproteobacteria bacterium]